MTTSGNCFDFFDQIAAIENSIGYGEAAVKLQRDWHPDPQNLPFAQHIKTHALVVLMQKGLQYHEIEHSFDQVGHISLTNSSTFSLH